jgi:hypothetical protein
MIMTCLSFIIFHFSVSPVVAQETTIGEVFKTMPDSLFPMLTRNNRLDMVDFMEAKMRAEVINRLEGTSEMVSLNHDSLTVIMSKSMTLTMYLLPTEDEYDNCQQVICLERHYSLTSTTASETVRSLYSLKWNPIRQLSPADQDKLRQLKASTILELDEKAALQ